MVRRSFLTTAASSGGGSDSDDELGVEDHPWTWIYRSASLSGPTSTGNRDAQLDIIGARKDNFECYVGDCVLLKAEGSNEAWVAIVTEFLEADEDGDKAANFLWFSTEKEIRNNDRKRTDFLPNELYITPSSDVNPLASINDKAAVMSEQEFLQRYPSGKVPRGSLGYNKTFVCRRGCDTRTTIYTQEFVWESVYSGKPEHLGTLLKLVQDGTRSTRKRRRGNIATVETDYIATPPEGDDEDEEEDSSDVAQRVPVTPRKRRKAPRTVTPSNRRVVIKKALEFTPLATRMLSPSHHQSSPFQLARAQLHVASVPASLPCRESEFFLVYSHLETAITDGSGACIYISGTPGTGKTATVREVVSKLDEAVRSDELDDFIFVEINGMKITDPHQSYTLLWEALKGQRVSPSQALELLEREFNNPSPRRVPCVVLMDELDQLVTKNQSVMYNFFNWPGLKHSRLIVLAVANTMDLPERTLSNKISSRLGLTRITFPGYNHEQLMKIIHSRLEGVPGNVVEPDAVQFASRKVAAVSGDARRALDICRRAVELAEADVKASGIDPATPSKRGKFKSGEEDRPKTVRGKVTIATVKRAINEATSSPLQQYLRALPFASKLVLSSLLIRNERTGLPDSTYGDVVEEMRRALVLDASSRRVSLLTSTGEKDSGVGRITRRDPKLARPAGISSAAADLAGAGIIILEAQRAERPSKIKLAVGDEEIKLAFRDDPEIRALGIAF
ncbi:P-loop containing nucleoside triphosphate hydrolase protein [Durotheca rogersii]|uniref:P-loop containing nucleoside triphosphate hydrolase protein n=1 Tax=Durotheca rogersii TaxID=419775 RepID=UPI002220AA1D|nr:P-loop containing nucleoside triphosphate hydrolase protein [Durotheca rogersii]KAI5864978.1 P-loop containing nucleoside triphosphate hydrolase protein [Durotheca rogersii]